MPPVTIMLLPTEPGHLSGTVEGAQGTCNRQGSLGQRMTAQSPTPPHRPRQPSRGFSSRVGPGLVLPSPEVRVSTSGWLAARVWQQEGSRCPEE